MKKFFLEKVIPFLFTLVFLVIISYLINFSLYSSSFNLKQPEKFLEFSNKFYEPIPESTKVKCLSCNGEYEKSDQIHRYIPLLNYMNDDGKIKTVYVCNKTYLGILKLMNNLTSNNLNNSFIEVDFIDTEKGKTHTLYDETKEIPPVQQSN